MWVFALGRLGQVKAVYRDKAIDLVRQIHPAFAKPVLGVVWKMQEDWTAPIPATALGFWTLFKATWSIGFSPQRNRRRRFWRWGSWWSENTLPFNEFFIIKK